MQFQRFVNFLPLAAGLFAIGWGLYGLLGPASHAASISTPADPSLLASGFQLPTEPGRQVFSRAWVKVDPALPERPSTRTPRPTSTVSAGGQRLGQIAEPTDAPAVPDRIVIPAVDLDAPIVVAPTRKLTLQEQVFEQWLAPDDFAAGWHAGSAFLGRPGNTVLNGHHNVFGKVFARLVELEPGDEIILYSGLREFHYVVAQHMILKERGASLAEREANARWILPSDDERLTLVTCWPADNNTHRLLIVASPLE